MKKEFWRDKKVFITGANGFVGSWLTRALIEKAAKVSVLIKEEIPRSYFNTKKSAVKRIFRGNVADYSLIEQIFKEEKPDVCFHLAAQAIVGKANQSPIPTLETNIKGTWNILEVAKEKGIGRLVIASSDKAYGEHKKLPYREEFYLSALHPYDASKACAEILARTYFHTYGLPLAITRCSNIYGGGDINFSRIIPDTIRSVLENKNPVIRSDGSPLRDYVYIEDVVMAYLILAEHIGEKAVNGQAFNFGTGRPISVLELVNKIIKLSGRESLKPVILGKGKLKGEIDKQYLDVAKARRILNWKVKYSLEEGLEKTIKWYENFFKQKKR